MALVHGLGSERCTHDEKRRKRAFGKNGGRGGAKIKIPISSDTLPFKNALRARFAPLMPMLMPTVVAAVVEHRLQVLAEALVEVDPPW